jgi:hypothetical protein
VLGSFKPLMHGLHGTKENRRHPQLRMAPAVQTKGDKSYSALELDPDAELDVSWRRYPAVPGPKSGLAMEGTAAGTGVAVDALSARDCP